MYLEDRILIDRPPRGLYALLSDLERHKDLLPGYLESRIVERKGETVVLQREAFIHGRRRRWKSEVSMEADRRIHFRQLEGPLKGMHVLWSLEPKDRGTELRISHDVYVRPWWKKWWMERVVAKPAIERTARLVLEALKQAAEARIPL
jgi:ribosome-associated toxin RatA of RatAB toxin-antitoxin module